MLIPNPQFLYEQDFYDDSVNVFSTIGQGPVGPKGDQGDDATDEQVYDQISEFISDHPEYVTSVVDGSISTQKIVDGAITTDKLAVASITSSKLDSQAVTTAKLADDSVTNAKLADNAVTNDNMANASVGTDELIDGSVTTAKLADGAITNAKLASTAIPTMSTSTKGIAKVGAGLAMNGEALELDGNGDIATAVSSWLTAHPEATTTVQDGAVTTAKLADGAVTDAKLAQSGVKDSFDPHLAPNLLDSDALTEGYIKSTGAVSVSGDWYTTDFIPVEYGKTYTYSYTNSSNVRTRGTAYFKLEFDSNKEIISGTYSDTGTGAYTPISSLSILSRFILQI